MRTEDEVRQIRTLLPDGRTRASIRYVVEDRGALRIFHLLQPEEREEPAKPPLDPHPSPGDQAA